MNVGGHMTIEVTDKNGAPLNSLQLPVFPDHTVTQDVRVTVVQTLSGIYTDDFGLGIETLQLKGNTAFESPFGKFNGNYVDGNTAAKHLYKDIIAYYFSREQTQAGSVDMHIYDDAFGRAWTVKPSSQLTLSASSTSPVVIYYQGAFVVLEDQLVGTVQRPFADPIAMPWKNANAVKKHAQQKVSASSHAASAVRQTKDFLYIVQPGDNLWTIAQNYLSRQHTAAQTQQLVNEIVHVNGIRTPSLIFPGERLRIPA